MGRMIGPGSGIAFADQRIGFVSLDNNQSAHLASSFDMLSVPGFHVLAEVCRSVRMHDEGLIPTH